MHVQVVLVGFMAIDVNSNVVVIHLFTYLAATCSISYRFKQLRAETPVKADTSDMIFVSSSI